MALIPLRYSSSVECTWDEWVQEWQRPKTRVNKHTADWCFICPAIFGAKYYVALVPSQPNCSGAGCRHPCLQTAPGEVPLLLRRLTASPKLPLGLCFLGPVQVEPALLTKWGLSMSAIPALPWVPLKPQIWCIWLSTLSLMLLSTDSS